MSRSLACIARPLLAGIVLAAVGGLLIAGAASAKDGPSRRGGSGKSFSGPSSSSSSSFRAPSGRSFGSNSNSSRSFSSNRNSSFKPTIRPSMTRQPSSSNLQTRPSLGGSLKPSIGTSTRKPSFTRPSVKLPTDRPTIRPGTIKPGVFDRPSVKLPTDRPTIRPGTIKPGVFDRPSVKLPTDRPTIRPGTIKPGVFDRPSVKLPTDRPTIRPGTLKPGVFDRPSVKLPTDRPTIRPGTIKPGTIDPGFSRPNLPGNLRPGGIKPGDVGIGGKPNLGDRIPGIKIAPRPIGKNGIPLGGIKLDDRRPNLRPNNLADRLQGNGLGKLINSNSGKKFDLGKQFDLKLKGDAARKLGLAKNLLLNGGWRNRFCHGPIHNSFSKCHFGSWYCGPGYYPSYCWFPNWNPWVEWSWWNHCHSFCDPRPIFCQPILCQPCPVWVHWNYPVWEPLPLVACGTWVDVPVVVVPAENLDLQLLAVRFVDPGHPEKQLGPRYRVWLRNPSAVDINAPFNVLLMAANDRQPSADLPQAGVRVERIPAGEIQSVDIRLPFAANVMNLDAEGREVPFSQLHVLVDSHNEVPEAFEKNNGAIVPRVDVLPVDPAIFAAETDAAETGAILNLAGEGLGPEPGQVLVLVNGLELQAEIHGWYDLGVQIQLPNLPLVQPAEAEILVIRGDTASANPLAITMLPAGAAAAAIAPAP